MDALLYAIAIIIIIMIIGFVLAIREIHKEFTDLVLSVIGLSISFYFFSSFVLFIVLGFSLLHFFDFFAFAARAKSYQKLLQILLVILSLPILGCSFIYASATMDFWTTFFNSTIYGLRWIVGDVFFIFIYGICITGLYILIFQTKFVPDANLAIFAIKKTRKALKLSRHLYKGLDVLRIVIIAFAAVFILFILVYGGVVYFQIHEGSTFLNELLSSALTFALVTPFRSLLSILEFVFSNTGAVILIISLAEMVFWSLRHLAINKFDIFKRKCPACNSVVYLQHPAKGLRKCPRCERHFITQDQKLPDDLIEYGVFLVCIKNIWLYISTVIFWIPVKIINFLNVRKRNHNFQNLGVKGQFH